MKNSKAFYRSALATAIVMALSAPAFATDSTVSTDPVTLNTEKTTLDQDVVINGDWICPYISRHLLSLNPLLACCRRYSRGER